MNFAERALPLLRLGLHVIPLKPYLPGQSPEDKRPKEAYWPNYQNMAQATEEEILQWNETNPNDNVGCIAKRESVWMLDVDTPELVMEIERDCGEKMPDTMMVRSGRTSTWAAHYYFAHEDESRKMTNGAIKNRGQWQIHNRYVVGPGSIHPSGNEYKSNGKPILPAPKWLIDYLNGRAETKKPRLSVTFSPDSKASEQRKFIDKFLADNKWEARGEWRDYVSPGGQAGFKIFVRCCNDAEHTPGEGNDSSSAILVADGLGLDFKCQHHHCLHLEWEDFRAAVEILPDLSSWTRPVAAAIPPPAAEEDEVEEVCAPNISVRPKLPFPEDILDTQLGRVAVSLDAPLTWSLFAVMPVFAAQGIPFTGSLQTNLYSGLLAEAGGGKTVVIERALQSIIYSEGITFRDDLISSDNALLLVLGGKKTKDLTPEDEIARPHLLYQDEGANLLAKNNIENSGLCFALNQLFSKTSYGKKFGAHEMRCYALVSLLMGLTCDSPAEFAELFGKSTINGFHRRMLFADGPSTWLPDDLWRPDPVILRPLSPISLPREVADMKHEWINADLKGRKNLWELALRMAITLTSAENLTPDRKVPGKSLITGVQAEEVWSAGITQELMGMALGLAEYQQRLREIYRPGIAESSTEARCTQTYLRGLEAVGEGVPKSYRDFYRQHSLQRYGAPTANRVRDNLVRDGIVRYGKRPGERGMWIMLLNEGYDDPEPEPESDE